MRHDTLSATPKRVSTGKSPPGAARLDRALILEKCSSFVDFQLWPIESVLDATGWLRNFSEQELEHALHLLNSFMFYPEHLTEELFASGFQSLSARLRSPGAAFQSARQSWEDFCERLIVTYVTGETPNPSDSGFTFARKARKVLKIEEERIVSPVQALKRLMLDPTAPVLFVDDFVGSGDQFIATWMRTYEVNGQFPYSFAQHSAGAPNARTYYCPAICTQMGADRILDEAATVVISPGNILPEQYSALHPKSVVWPDQLRTTAVEFLHRASLRAGIPDEIGKANDWRGHHQLGLTLGFSDSVPDATLPIFYWEKNGWHPLLRRT